MKLDPQIYFNRYNGRGLTEDVDDEDEQGASFDESHATRIESIFGRLEQLEGGPEYGKPDRGGHAKPGNEIQSANTDKGAGYVKGVKRKSKATIVASPTRKPSRSREPRN